MYDLALVKSAFSAMVQFRQNVDPEGLQLDPAPSGSPEAGIFLQDLHPLITLNNIASTIADYELIDSGTANVKFSTHVNNIVGNAAMQVVNDWFSFKNDVGTIHNLQDRAQLFMGSGNITDLETPQGDLVGFEINMRKTRGLQYAASHVSLHLNAAQDLIVYLFSRQKASIVEQTTITAVANEVVWKETPLFKMKSEDGPFYICYDEDDLIGENKAINSVYPSGYYDNCLIYPAGKYYKPRGFRAAASPTGIWDADLNRYTLSTNFGLNLRFTTFCDYTDFLIEQKLLFKDAYAKQCVIKILELLAVKPAARNVRNVVNIDRDYVTYLLDGDGKGVLGLRREYKKLIDTISLNSNGLDRDCLTCQETSIEYSST